MARTLKTTKDKLVQLLNVTDLVPASKLATDIGKHLGFRKALKKHLKDYIDAKAEAVEKVKNKQNEIVPKKQRAELMLKTLEETDYNKRAEFENKIIMFENELQNFVTKENDALDKLTEDLKLKKVEVSFDNEEALFEKNVIKDNATTIFKLGDDRFNADRAELIYDILDSIE